MKLKDLTPTCDDCHEYVYSPADRERIARCAINWDERYLPPNPTRIELVLRHEFRLYLQYMTTRQESDPLNPTPESLERWMAPSRGFDVENVRRTVNRRLHELTGSDVFLNCASALGQRLRYPDWRHLIRWYDYHRAVVQRSRACFDRITTEQVIDTERKTWPYYTAMTLADGEHTRLAPSNSDSGYNAFAESDRVAVDLVETLVQLGKDDRPLRVLEFGCGDGRLLLALSRRFPHSELIGTSLVGKQGFLPAVVAEPRIRIVTDSVEAAGFEPNSFDVVISTEVIEHLVDPTVMVRNIRRLLRPGGVFVVTAPSLHVQFLSRNPLTYFVSLASVLYDRILPPFHNLYEPLTDLPLVHYSFSWQKFRAMFRAELPQAEVRTMRFFHLRKFRLHSLATHIPIVRRFGGLLVAYGRK